MEIRLLQQEEVNTATDLLASNYPEHPEYREKARAEITAMFVKHPVQPTYVAAFEGKSMIGFAGIAPSWMDYSVWEILWVNVTQEQQGKGIGSNLIRALIDIARDAGEKTIILSCTAPAFYERFGFRVICPLAGGYQLMVLQLESEAPKNEASEGKK